MKRALKISLKAIGIVLGSVLSFLVLCCAATLVWGTVQMTRGSVTDTLPETPDDFIPAIRLIVFTDTHNENENVAAAIDTAYALFDNDEVYQGVDGFFGLGDFTSIGTEPDYAAYADVLNEHVREDTVLINVLGNHEMKADNYEQLFTQYFSHETNTVTEINGFICIGFSGERSLTEWTFTPSSLKWLSDEIHKAESLSENKPVFVFQHPHPFGTVYGSSVWCTPQLNPVFAGHSRVISFSGHSHFPMNDPRSINQSTYTAVGVGAMARFELDKNYLVGQHPAGYENAAQFAVVEADNDGRVRIRGYDLLSGTFFCDYFIENVNDKDTFAYTYKNMKSHDSAPVFSESTQAHATKEEDGSYTIAFTEASAAEGFIVHSYEVTIRDKDGRKLCSDIVIAPYYILDDSNTAEFSVPPQLLTPSEEYTLELTARSAYHLKSLPVTLTFTAP